MRRTVLYALALGVIMSTVLARIYEEVIQRRWPAPGPPVLRFWRSDAALPVDLSRFFNNDGIASKPRRGEPLDANFDCPDHPPDVPGSGYPAEALPGSGTVFPVADADVRFLFPVVTPGEFNNVSCQGQRLSGTVRGPWPKAGQSCREIAFLGSAENGSAAGKVTLEYDDDSIQRVALSFPDWCVKPGPHELVAVASTYRYARGQGRRGIRHTINCYLLVKRIPVDPEKTLIAVTLPETPNLHVFAMTLKVAEPATEVAYRGDALARKYHRAAALADAPEAQLEQPVAALGEALEQAAQTIDPKLARQLTWLKTRHAYLVHRLGGRIIRQGSLSERWARKTARTIRDDLAALLKGTDPFVRRRGAILKGYVSEIDGQIQPYALRVPGDYRKDTPRPLVVHMHGHGWYRPFQGVPAPAIRNAIVLSPHGRGSMDYMFVAEEDVLACIDEVIKDYAVDSDRVYLMGHSMGGTGSWNLSVRYPDRFAAIAPSAANADSRAWKKVGAKHVRDDGSFAWLRGQIRDLHDPVQYAGNLLHVPAYFLHGDRDKVVPVGNSRSMAKALAALEEEGARFTYQEGKGGGHGWRPRKYVTEQHNFLFGCRRERRPGRVRLKAGALKYGRAYWLRILQKDRWDQFAEVKAEVQDESYVYVETGNVTALEIELGAAPLDTRKAAVVVVDGESVFTDLAPPGGRITVVRAGGAWQLSPGLAGLRKKPYLEGPVSDAFTRSFLLVVGTRCPDPVDRATLRQEAERFAADWERLYANPPRLKTDRAVTDQDIARHNLVLYGGPKDNAVTARIAAEKTLPITIRRGAIRVGARTYSDPGACAKFCYPNPLNPERLIVVIGAAHRARDLFQTNNLFGNWFQWGPYDNRVWFDFAVFDRKTHSAETCLDFGFFAGDWGFHRETRWTGDPQARAAAVPRRIPAHPTPPDRKTVRLSDLVPVSIEQHKLSVGFDTSAEGRGLSIGRPGDPTYREFPRGLGVRAPSKIVFDVNRPAAPAAERFTRFRATVGIDLEGETVVPPWRKKQEWVTFLVRGDGHLLYQTGRLKWNSKPVNIDVPISRVKQLELQVWCTRARWLVGSAAWGDARIVRASGKGAN